MKMYPLRLDNEFHDMLKRAASKQKTSIHAMILMAMSHHCLKVLGEESEPEPVIRYTSPPRLSVPGGIITG